jgi:hypothetical protein
LLYLILIFLNFLKKDKKWQKGNNFLFKQKILKKKKKKKKREEKGMTARVLFKMRVILF